MLLVRNAELYDPEPRGRRDILVAGGRIVAVEESIDPSSLPVPCRVVEAAGRVTTPGLVDGHVHVTGGGGEGGFRTRTPELSLTDATLAGVTTVVGMLGTDGVARSVEALVAKAYALREEGLSAWCCTGSYRFPPVTVTGDVMKDIMMIDPVIGLGELALSDHRSTKPTDDELARVAAEARLGGMLSGKAGIVVVHLGDAPEGMAALERVVSRGDLPRTQFMPTHCNRNPRLMEEAVAWARAGGHIDFTAGSSDGGAAAALVRLRGEGTPTTRASVSSDGQGSLPRFDAAGVLVGMGVGSCRALLETVREAVGRHGLPLGEVLATVTANPARALGLARKGRIAPGMDADILILDEGLTPTTVLAMGRVMVFDRTPEVFGTFEESPGR